MSVGSVGASLIASRKDGRGVTSAEFLEPLAIRPGEVEGVTADGGAWTSGVVDFHAVRLSDFDHLDKSEDAGAQTEAFYHAIIQRFLEIGRFLDRRATELTTGMRAAGLSLEMSIEVRMDQDQMELELPPEFLAAVSRHGMTVKLISNDIPAYEIWAAG